MDHEALSKWIKAYLEGAKAKADNKKVRAMNEALVKSDTEGHINQLSEWMREEDPELQEILLTSPKLSEEEVLLADKLRRLVLKDAEGFSVVCLIIQTLIQENRCVPKYAMSFSNCLRVFAISTAMAYYTKAGINTGELLAAIELLQ